MKTRSRNPHQQMSKSTPQLGAKSKRKDVLENSREQGWDSSPNYRLPDYNSEKDPYCPRAMIRRFNKVKKDNAMEHARRGQGASDWIEKTIKKKFEELPIVVAPTLREKAYASGAAIREESLTEVEILQKIIVRENLLSELQKLLQFQVDLDGILSEVDELIRAIRYQTLEVIEEIALWKSESKAPRQFYYRGQNYLLKLLSDTSFLDEYDDLGDHYGFYFTGNPLFYDGIVQRTSNSNEFSALNSSHFTMDMNMSINQTQMSIPHHTNSINTNTNSNDDLDGIQLCRLHDAELVLQNESIQFQNTSSTSFESGPPTASASAGVGVGVTQSSVLHIGEAHLSMIDKASTSASVASLPMALPLGRSDSYAMPSQRSTSRSIQSHQRDSLSPADGNGNKRRSPDGTLKPVKVLNELKFKRTRVRDLEEEVGEIQAMSAHVEDQMTAVLEEIQILQKKLTALEKKKQEAIANGKIALAQKFMIEEGIIGGDIDHKKNEIKDFQRKKYFLEQERSRRKGLIRVLENEIKAMTKQSVAKKKLMKKAKTEGLLSALLSTSVVMDESATSSSTRVNTNKRQQQQGGGGGEGGETQSEIGSYQISPSSQKKGEDSFSDDEEEGEDGLEAGESIFGFSGSKFESITAADSANSSALGGASQSHLSQQQQQQQLQQHRSRIDPSPLMNAPAVISEIQILSSLFSDSVVTRSLEMLWFVMVAAEDIRPKKIMIRNFISGILSESIQKIEILKDTAAEFVGNAVWEGYHGATSAIINEHYRQARVLTGHTCVHKSFEIAQNLIQNSFLEKAKRSESMKQILRKDLAQSFVSSLLTSQIKIASIRHVTCSLFIQQKVLKPCVQNFLEHLQPVMCSFEQFSELVEEQIIGAIGAAVYTIDTKVIPTRNTLKNFQIQNPNLNSNSVMGALPVGTGFALAKAKKTAKDVIELEILNLQTKEIVTHLYHTDNGDYASIQDAISDATQHLDGMDGSLFVFEELTMCFQSDIVLNGRTYNLKVLKDERKYRMLLELFDIRMKSKLKIQLTKKQEKELEYVRNIPEYLQQLFQQTSQFLGEGLNSLHEAMIQKSGETILVAKDIVLAKDQKHSKGGGGLGVEVLLEVDEISINYQPYNLKVTEDEMGIRIEVWNLKIGKVVGTRLTKRQEREFHEVKDRQQFLVNLLGTPGFAFLL